MFLELIATFVAGLAGAGVAMLVNKLLGGRLPRWVIPIAAGASMLGITISNEYTWYPRQEAALPDGIEIALTVENQAVYRPWTYLYPYVSRFIAVDRFSIRTNDAQPGLRLVDVLTYGRWAPVNRLRVVVDCDAARRADIVEGVTMTESGAFEGAVWRDAGPDDPIIETTCREE